MFCCIDNEVAIRLRREATNMTLIFLDDGRQSCESIIPAAQSCLNFGRRRLSEKILSSRLSKCLIAVPVCTTAVHAPIQKEHDFPRLLSVNNRGQTVVGQPLKHRSQPSGQAIGHGVCYFGALSHPPSSTFTGLKLGHSTAWQSGRANTSVFVSSVLTTLQAASQILKTYLQISLYILLYQPGPSSHAY